MKRLFLLFTLLYAELYALEKVSTLKVYHGIFSALHSYKQIVVYTNDKEYLNIFKYSKQIIVTNKLEESDIILVTEQETLKNVVEKINTNDGERKMPIIFATKYQLLKFSEDVVGAFYWRKGRSQLLFIRKRLDVHHIKLPTEYQNFMIDAL